MKTQERREGEAVVIVTAMLGLAAVVFIGIVLFEVVTALVGPVNTPLDVGLQVLLGLFVASLAGAPLGYLYRYRRP